MTIFQIELIDPKARRLLEDLADLNLIKIQEIGNPKDRFFELIKKLRSNDNPPTLEEITKEVEKVRS